MSSDSETAPALHSWPEYRSDISRMRLMRSIELSVSDCWGWSKSLDRYGYGRFKIPTSRGESVATTSHRAMWLAFVGDIPPGMHIDHLCRNRSCINPRHMELVTPGENLDRGLIRVRNRAKLGHPVERRNAPRSGKEARFCPAGHPKTEENTRHYVNGQYPRSECRICRKLRNQKRSQKA